MRKSIELREKRAKAVADARVIFDAADKESRDLSSEEEVQYDKIDEEIRALDKDIQRVETLEARELSLKAPISDKKPPRNDPDDPKKTEKRGKATPEYAEAWEVAMREGTAGLTREQRTLLREVRALEIGVGSEGGFLVPDQHFPTLIEAQEDANVMRTPGLCTVIQTSSGTGDLPVVSSRGAAGWDDEEASYEENDDVFAQVTLKAYKMTRINKVSEELVADTQFPLPAYLAGSFGKSFGDLEEAALVNGDGTLKPTGIVVGSGLGVTAAGTGAITADELLDLYFSLGTGYRKNGTFMSADLTVKILRKLKDGNSQYLWQPGLIGGAPDTLLGRPFLTANDMPAATTGLKSVLFADYSYYWIADRGQPVFKRLDELYAATGQIGFAANRRVDGKLTLAAAAKHLIQA